MAKQKKNEGGLLGLVAGLERAFGRGILMPLEGAESREVPVIPTGSRALDEALGIGGAPRGRISEIYGPEGSGKTTLAMSIVAQAQKLGGLCAVIDAEHALDTRYAAQIGCDLSRLLLSQPDSGEQALQVVETLARSGEVDVIVVDSVAALVPRAEIEGEMGDHTIGVQARLMSQAMRKLTPIVSRTGTTLIFINQTRQKIGVMFGSPETTTGGTALKFYASLRIEVRRIGALKKGDEIYGNRTRIRVVKNKFAPPFRTVQLDLRFGQGFDGPAELLELALERGVLSKSGSYYKLGGETIGQGKDAVLQRLNEGDALRETVERALAAPPVTETPVAVA